MFIIPSYFGTPVYAWLGLLLAVMTGFQIGTGRRWIKLDFKFHRVNGILIGIVGAIHAFFAIAAYFFGIKVQGF